IVAIGVKARSAIMLAGHRADIAMWYSKGQGVTSSALLLPMPALPLSDFFGRYRVDLANVPVWDRALPPAKYQFIDDAPGEQSLPGGGRVFPHPISAPVAAAENRWQASPFADQQVLHAATGAVQDLGLGRRSTPDYLGVALSALDLSGHAFG